MDLREVIRAALRAFQREEEEMPSAHGFNSGAREGFDRGQEARCATRRGDTE
ncbi:hypothetical protein [Mesorhizobium sp. WSM3860]|uniref:hypothetical protein n=1 Tax=Mesorhizobium sp. WSM3860 TaxID=2029403 RepID=UPI001FE1B9CF|nr:hypothetical protein [Mesorhizobium sp. WSM3860]